MIAFALWVLASTVWHGVHGTLPRAEIMGVVGHRGPRREWRGGAGILSFRAGATRTCVRCGFARAMMRWATRRSCWRRWACSARAQAGRMSLSPRSWAGWAYGGGWQVVRQAWVELGFRAPADGRRRVAVCATHPLPLTPPYSPTPPGAATRSGWSASPAPGPGPSPSAGRSYSILIAWIGMASAIPFSCRPPLHPAVELALHAPAPGIGALDLAGDGHPRRVHAVDAPDRHVRADHRRE